MTTTAAFAIAGVMAVIAVAALVLSVALARRPAESPPNNEDRSALLMEVMILRDKNKELGEVNDKLLAAGVQMEEADREKAEANRQIWVLAEKLAGILGYTNFDSSVERLESMPGVDDEPSLYQQVVVNDKGEIVDVVPTNNLKLAYVQALTSPKDHYDKVIAPLIEERRRKTAQGMPTHPNMPAMAEAGMVSKEDASGRGSARDD